MLWLVEETWPACVDVARNLLPAEAPITLLRVTPEEVGEAAGGAYSRLLGRAHRERDPRPILEATARGAARELLAAVSERLSRPAASVQRTGRVEGEVLSASVGASRLVVARDGDLTRIGPASLGHSTRFIVDHAPCPVLLVWPVPASHPQRIPRHPTDPWNRR